MTNNFQDAFEHLLAASYRVLWKYRHPDWKEWDDLRDALQEMQACKNDLVVSPEYFLSDKQERTLLGEFDVPAS